MDESDMKLAEQLREQLEANGAKTAFDAPQQRQQSRRAKPSRKTSRTTQAASWRGRLPRRWPPTARQSARADAEATAAAERHLQDVVRAELAGGTEPCSGDER
jgi:hypothetical protein